MATRPLGSSQIPTNTSRLYLAPRRIAIPRTRRGTSTCDAVLSWWGNTVGPVRNGPVAEHGLIELLYEQDTSSCQSHTSCQVQTRLRHMPSKPDYARLSRTATINLRFAIGERTVCGGWNGNETHTFSCFGRKFLQRDVLSGEWHARVYTASSIEIGTNAANGQPRQLFGRP
ncbi:hypothetical protein BDZ85DRAFT_263907 [Elsinoe ampelina]|uniref:Uncharacterized protein n=1 Tax=Elsinoe ampelina TaxID=302913 RepID=A0A6A6GA68_9PEZI|nr:hypothetical protein BDZ85DRAFT_263907 [Elsinoe ampelina]